MLDANEAAFLRSNAEEPAENTGRLVFADWLDDRGHSDLAAAYRFAAEKKVHPQQTLLGRRLYGWTSLQIGEALWRLADESHRLIIKRTWNAAFLRLSIALKSNPAAF